MADNCSSTSSTSSVPSKMSSQSGRGRATTSNRKQKQELRRVRVKRAISLKADDDVTAEINDLDDAAAAAAAADKTRETVNVNKDTPKTKHETDTNKVAKLKDQELNKLRQDLAKCQLELREEVEKRGQSSSARSGFEHERRRLLGELRDAGEAKRRLEMALDAASTNIKRKTAEMREMQDAEKAKLAALEKSANNEIRKLLDELKSKDQLIAHLQSTDKHGCVKNEKHGQLKSLSKKSHHISPQLSSEPIESNFDNSAGIFPYLSANISAPRRIYLLEKQLQQWAAANEYLNKCNKEFGEEKLNLEKSAEKLRNENKQLKQDLDTLKIEASKLSELLSEKNILLIKDQIESLKETNHGQKIIIESMHLEGRSIIKQSTPKKKKVPTATLR